MSLQTPSGDDVVATPALLIPSGFKVLVPMRLQIPTFAGVGILPGIETPGGFKVLEPVIG